MRISIFRNTHASMKPWVNEVASRRKFSTCEYLRLRFARIWVDLRRIAFTLNKLDQICTQVEASFSPFGHPTQVNAIFIYLFRVLNCSARRSIEMAFLVESKLATPFGHPTQVCTQPVHISKLATTCDHLRLRLKSKHAKHFTGVQALLNLKLTVSRRRY